MHFVSLTDLSSSSSLGAWGLVWAGSDPGTLGLELLVWHLPRSALIIVFIYSVLCSFFSTFSTF